MNPVELIEDVKEHYSEHLEMSDDPSSFIIGVLAYKVSSLQSYVEYLEKRLEYANRV